MHLRGRRSAPILLTGLLLACVASSCKSTTHSFRREPPVVEVVNATQKTVPIYRQYIGQTVAVNAVEIRSQVTGLLRTIAFREGSVVHKGQLLFTIDPRSYQAALDQARANLAQTEAVLRNDRTNLARDQVLFRKHVLSAQQLDTQIAQTQEAEANVGAAQAAVATAALNLSYTKIYAPIKGRIGMAQVKVGTLIQQNSTLLDTIYSINPIYVDFSITEAAYLDYREEEVNDRSVDLSLRLTLPNDSVYAYKGKIVMTNPTVNSTTGTLGLRAEFPNPEGLLRPGLFVKVKALVGEKADAVLIPEQAVQTIQGQESVYVLGPGNKAEFRSVSLGPTVNHMRVINHGVRAHERVIVAGQQKVRPGMTVRPVAAGATHHSMGLAPIRAQASR